MANNFWPSTPVSATYFLSPAKLIAPEGSQIALVSLKVSFMAAHISSVVTVITSSTVSRITAKVASPTCLTAVPSAKIPTSDSLTGSPESIAALRQAASSDSTAMIFVAGRNFFKYAEIPAHNPPPPTAIKTASNRSGNCR